jgi:hypothetical protein
MTKKKVKKKIKTKPHKKKSKKKSECSQGCKRPVSDYYDIKTGEIYPKIFFRQDTLWDKIRRFFGYIP